MPAVPKLYVIVREDLSPGARVAQAVHGAHGFADAHPTEYARWRSDSNTVAVLGAQGEPHLRYLMEMARTWDIPHASFQEPDMAGASTVLVLAPGPASQRLTRGLPLLS
jgi:peptidyl-tRNA hydrolase